MRLTNDELDDILSWYRESHVLYDRSVRKILAEGVPRSELVRQGAIAQGRNLPWAQAEALASKHEYDLVDIIRGQRPGDDVLVVKCRACGRQTAQRPGDVHFGCTCGGTKTGGVAYGQEAIKPSTALKDRKTAPRTPGAASVDRWIERHVINHLRETNPELAEEWVEALDGPQFTPETVKSGSRRRVLWRCIACGHEWCDTVRNRELRMNNRCPSCRKVMGSLAWQYPELAEEWSHENPVSPWNTKPYGKLDFIPQWVCRNNPEHVWTSTTAARIQGRKPCPWCSKHE